MTEQQKEWYKEFRNMGQTCLASWAYAVCGDMSIRGVEYRYDMQKQSCKNWHGRANFVEIPVCLAITSIAPSVWPMLKNRKQYIQANGSLKGYTGK